MQIDFMAIFVKYLDVTYVLKTLLYSDAILVAVATFSELLRSNMYHKTSDTLLFEIQNNKFHAHDLLLT